MVPSQYTGKELTTTASIDLYNEEEASRFFTLAVNRLLDVNNWHEMAEGISAIFRVTDNLGQEVNRNVQEGDCLQIDIPGPGSTKGEGFDWVRDGRTQTMGGRQYRNGGFSCAACRKPQKQR